MADVLDRGAAEQRFALVFAHLGAVAAYARRRGSSDADGIAAEVMTIAWRRLRRRAFGRTLPLALRDRQEPRAR